MIQDTSSNPPRSRARWWPRISFLIAALITLVGAFYAEENWRGRHAWLACQRELLARGEHLDPKFFYPPPLADEQNFLKVAPLEQWFTKNPVETNRLNQMPRLPLGLKDVPPSLVELKSWDHLASILEPETQFPSQDRSVTPAAALLSWFENYHDGLNALYEAAQRKGVRFDGHYERGIEADVPHYVHARLVAQAIAGHAIANLLIGKPEHALRDLTVLRRMVAGFTSSPTLVGVMIGVAMAGLYDEVVHQGLRENLWQPEQLLEIQQQEEAADFIKDYSRSMRGGEMATLLHFLDTASSAKLVEVLGSSKGWDKFVDVCFYRLCPRGWVDQNMVRYAHLMSDAMQTLDVGAGRIYPSKCPAIENRVFREVKRTPYTYVLACCVPNTVKALRRIAERQAQADLTGLACALERYRSTKGTYPPTLSTLVPHFTPLLPSDHITGGELKYRKTDDGRCLVYSVGWNMEDDGGSDDDWVWTSPPR